MKLLLHGAINLSNFGDYLFAKIFYDYIKDRGQDVDFYTHPQYGISSFFRRHLGYHMREKNCKLLMAKSDALIFIPGGYFVNSSKKGLLSQLRHIKRYLFPALYFMKKKKPIYILGVGAGPFNNSLFSCLARKIMNYATVVYVRNEESKKYCLELGVTTDIKVTTDTAILIENYMKDEPQSFSPFVKPAGQKALMLHVNGDAQTRGMMFNNVIPAIEEFLSNHTEYQLYLAADGMRMEKAYKEYAAALSKYNPISFEYDDPMQLCQRISQMDIVVTPKLHVGIVSSVLGKSVLSFPVVPQKTQRFYRQIGEQDRCIPLADVTPVEVLKLLEEKKNSYISVSSELKSLAYENLKALPMKEG